MQNWRALFITSDLKKFIEDRKAAKVAAKEAKKQAKAKTKKSSGSSMVTLRCIGCDFTCQREKYKKNIPEGLKRKCDCCSPPVYFCAKCEDIYIRHSFVRPSRNSSASQNKSGPQIDDADSNDDSDADSDDDFVSDDEFMEEMCDELHPEVEDDIEDMDSDDFREPIDVVHHEEEVLVDDDDGDDDDEP